MYGKYDQLNKQKFEVGDTLMGDGNPARRGEVKHIQDTSREREYDIQTEKGEMLHYVGEYCLQLVKKGNGNVAAPSQSDQEPLPHFMEEVERALKHTKLADLLGREPS
jgi:hypothetical protein